MELTRSPHKYNKKGQFVPSASYGQKIFLSKGKPEIVAQWRYGHPATAVWFTSDGTQLESRPEWISWDPAEYEQRIDRMRLKRALTTEEGIQLAKAYLEQLKKTDPAMTVEQALDTSFKVPHSGLKDYEREIIEADQAKRRGRPKKQPTANE